MIIAINAKPKPIKFNLVSFSLKSQIPTKEPSVITPISKEEKTTDGLLLSICKALI